MNIGDRVIVNLGIITAVIPDANTDLEVKDTSGRIHRVSSQWLHVCPEPVELVREVIVHSPASVDESAGALSADVDTDTAEVITQPTTEKTVKKSHYKGIKRK